MGYIKKRVKKIIKTTIAACCVQEKLLSLGAEPLVMPPDEFGTWMNAQVENWAKVVQEAGIRIEN